jgi:hypothetical protein
MKTWLAFFLMCLPFATGCGQWRPEPPPVIAVQRIVTVSGDDPFVDMEDGTRIGVDGVPSGQSMQFKLTRYKDINGKEVLGVYAVSEPMSEPEQP